MRRALGMALAVLVAIAGCADFPQIKETDTPAEQELKISAAAHMAEIASIRGESEARIAAAKIKAEVEGKALAEKLRLENRKQWLDTFPAGLFTYCGVGLFVLSVLAAFVWSGNRATVIGLGAIGMVTLSAYGKVAADYPQYLIYAAVAGIALTIAFYARSVLFKRATGIVCQAVEISDAWEAKTYIQSRPEDARLIETAGRSAIEKVIPINKAKANREAVNPDARPVRKSDSAETQRMTYAGDSEIPNNSRDEIEKQVNA